MNNRLECDRLINSKKDDKTIHLESQLRSGNEIRNKSKTILPTYKYVSNGYLNQSTNSNNIDMESSLLQSPILNQAQKSTSEFKCLNRFETLFRDVQNVEHIIPEFNISGIGTRQYYKKKTYDKNHN